MENSQLKKLEEITLTRYEHLTKQNRKIFEKLLEIETRIINDTKKIDELQEIIKKNELINDIYKLRSYDQTLRNMSIEELQTLLNNLTRT